VSELLFKLDVEDDWPSVPVECLPCTAVPDGYRVNDAPLFIKELSVDDVICVSLDPDGQVSSWTHVRKSDRSTIWLLQIGPIEAERLENAFRDLHGLGYNTVRLPEYGCYSVDVPPECPIENVDSVLDALDSSSVVVAYPSFRHEE
jgi:hypothetical protein